MALGTLLAAAAPALISAGGSFLSSKFAPKPKGGGGQAPGGTGGFQPTNFSGGGLTGTFSDGRFGVTSDADRQGTLNQLRALFPEQANLTRGLRDRVSPGFSALRKSRLAAVEDARTRAIGNLKDNLGRRRVLGSSFGQDALTRTEAEFGRQRDAVEADVELQEIGLTDKFIKDEFDLRRQDFAFQLDELGIQAELAADLAKGATAQLAANARIKEQLNVRTESAQQVGAGTFFGQNLDPVFRSLGTAIGSGISDFSNQSGITFDTNTIGPGESFLT